MIFAGFGVGMCREQCAHRTVEQRLLLHLAERDLAGNSFHPMSLATLASLPSPAWLGIGSRLGELAEGLDAGLTPPPSPSEPGARPLPGPADMPSGPGMRICPIIAASSVELANQETLPTIAIRSVRRTSGTDACCFVCFTKDGETAPRGAIPETACQRRLRLSCGRTLASNRALPTVHRPAAVSARVGEEGHDKT